MPFRSLGNTLKRRLEQLQRLNRGNTEATGIIARYRGGSDATVQCRSEEQSIVITAASKAAASELMLQEAAMRRELTEAGIPAHRIIIR
jgi:hypothetical protein